MKLQILLIKLALVVAFTGLITGCVIIPTPHYYAQGSRMNVNRQSVNLIQPGADTKADVILKLGEPDAVSPDERRTVYESAKVVGWLIAMADTGDNEMKQWHFLNIMFDENGVVTNREFSKHELSMLAGSINDEKIRVGFACSWGDQLHFHFGNLMLTDTKLYFADGSQRLNEPPRLCLPYDTFSDCRCVKNGLLFPPKLSLHTKADRDYSFEPLDVGRSARTTVESACQLVQSKISSTPPIK